MDDNELIIGIIASVLMLAWVSYFIYCVYALISKGSSMGLIIVLAHTVLVGIGIAAASGKALVIVSVVILVIMLSYVCIRYANSKTANIRKKRINDGEYVIKSFKCLTAVFYSSNWLPVLLLGIEGNRYLVLSGDYVLSLANGDKRDSDVIDSDDEELVIESVGGTISATMVAGTDEIVDFEMSYDQNIRAMESDTELEYNVVMALKDKTIISAEELRAIFDLGKD